MRIALFRALKLMFFSLYWISLWGCASMMETLPPPPGFPAQVELNGPYDADIPAGLANQLKKASLVSDDSVPYIFMHVAIHFETTGDELRAVHFLDRAGAEFRKRNILSGEGVVLTRKVSVLCQFGRLQEAEKIIKETQKNRPDASLNPFIFYNYGHYYRVNGDYQKAREYFRQALQSNQNFHNDINLLMLRRDTELEYGITLISADYFPALKGRLYSLVFDDTFYLAIRRHTDEAVFHLQEVISLNNEIRKSKVNKLLHPMVIPIIEARVYNFLGLALAIKGQMPEALAHINTSLQWAHQADFRIAQADSLFFLNQAYLLAKKVTEGKNAAYQLREIAQGCHLHGYSIWANMILAHYHVQLGNTQKAVASFKDAVLIMEKQKPPMTFELFKAFPLFDYQALFGMLIELSVKDGDARGGWEWAEKAKARSMVDLLAGQNIAKTAAEADLIKKYEAGQQRIAAGYRKLFASDGSAAAFEKALDHVEKIENEQKEILHGIKTQNEKFYALTFGQWLRLDEFQQLMDSNTTFFSYYVSEKTLYVWAIRRERVYLQKIAMSREAVDQLVLDFRQALAGKDQEKMTDIAEKAYNQLLKPIIPFVSGDRIGFILHGSLHYLPFAAMRYVGAYLVDGFSIFYLPHAGMFKYVLQKNTMPHMRVLALANPDLMNPNLSLSHAKAEMESIKQIVPQAVVYWGKKAAKSRITALTGDYDLIHFTAHGVFMGQTPLQSGLLLAPGEQDDGYLTVAEIFRLSFKGRTVIASAGQTHTGPSFQGLDVVAFNMAWLFAGSASVVNTLWNVDNSSTATFMKIFYGHLVKGESIAEGLRMSQIEMIRLGFAPFDWAAFTLTGKY